MSKNKIADLDNIETTASLAKALLEASEIIKAGERVAPAGGKPSVGALGEKWAPSGHQSSNETKNIEPSVTPKSKTTASMGGNPEAKRAVPEGENQGGYEQLDGEDAGEGPTGASRVKRARKKGKGTVPTLDSRIVTPSLKSLCEHGIDLKKSRCRYCGQEDGSGDQSADGAMDENDFDTAEPSDYDDEDQDQDGAPVDGDDDVSDELMEVVQALEQSPQLVRVLSAVLSGGSSQDDEQDPQQQGSGSQNPYNDPRFSRSMEGYVNELEKGFVDDPRAADISEGMEISPVLEALIDNQNNAFGFVLAKLDKGMRRQTMLEKHVIALESVLTKSMTLVTDLIKSVSDGTSPFNKSLSDITVPSNVSMMQAQRPPSLEQAQEMLFPSPGISVASAPPAPENTTILDRNVLSKSLTDQANEGDKYAANLLGFIDLPEGLVYAKNHMHTEHWEHYEKSLNSTRRAS